MIIIGGRPVVIMRMKIMNGSLTWFDFAEHNPRKKGRKSKGGKYKDRTIYSKGGS
jgi:hypothetical protein